ncbi:hypothetical protein DEO72_LG11g1687 [Vigna unguiculata]|uniref:Uncharacterized protein n=1 Tax=Vigna unguiculata TaxID=3917 RepID=A0A4D6NLK0_VIGUN|nr:hypothetical protein DEO72_LG11g1687 [Vigna unguiculata]
MSKHFNPTLSRHSNSQFTSCIAPKFITKPFHTCISEYPTFRSILLRAQFREPPFSSSSSYLYNNTLLSLSTATTATTPFDHCRCVTSGSAAPPFLASSLSSLSRLSPCHHTPPSLPPRSSGHRRDVAFASVAPPFRP